MYMLVTSSNVRTENPQAHYPRGLAHSPTCRADVANGGGRKREELQDEECGKEWTDALEILQNLN